MCSGPRCTGYGCEVRAQRRLRAKGEWPAPFFTENRPADHARGNDQGRRGIQQVPKETYSTHRYAHMTWHRFAPSVRSICQGVLGPVSHQPLLRCPFDRSTRARVVCCLPLLCEARADLDAPGMRTASTVRFVIHCGIAFAVCAEQLSLRGTKFR